MYELTWGQAPKPIFGPGAPPKVIPEQMGYNPIFSPTGSLRPTSTPECLLRTTGKRRLSHQTNLKAAFKYQRLPIFPFAITESWFHLPSEKSGSVIPSESWSQKEASPGPLQYDLHQVQGDRLTGQKLTQDLTPPKP